MRLHVDAVDVLFAYDKKSLYAVGMSRCASRSVEKWLIAFTRTSSDTQCRFHVFSVYAKQSADSAEREGLECRAVLEERQPSYYRC